MTTVIEVQGLTVAFGTFKPVDNVSLTLEHGRRYALIGPNGAGKTTLLNAMSGRQTPAAGRILMGGRDVTPLSASERARAGLGRSFQIVNLFPELTVRENLIIAAQAARFGRRQPWHRLQDRYPELGAKADALLTLTELNPLRDQPASTLSHGDQRLLELGLSLASEPTVLLLDEPLAGVGHERVGSTVAMISRIAEGRTVLLVEHNMQAVMQFAEEIIVLCAGAVLARGTPDNVRADSRVRSAYLGT